MSNHFYINQRDIEFVLFEQLKVQDLDHERFADFGRDDYDMVIAEGIKFAREVLGPLNQDADRIGCTFDNGEVTMPPGSKGAFKLAGENGWISAAMSTEYGGMGLPLAIGAALNEVLLAGCTSVALSMELSAGVGHLIDAFGTDEQKARYVERLYTGQWTGCMDLTEPGAGSFLADLRTTATPVEGEDYYHIDGVKCFITSGEQDLTDNVIHAVLARMPGGPPGTKGLGLFIVPKVLVNGDGSLGARNDLMCGGIEHKMGIHGSPTCTINFGEHGTCRGWLVGEEPFLGMRMMFQLMNESRVVTGMQGVALAGVAYENAVRYAQERVQGVDIVNFKNPEAPRVTIIHHPDVRRMLLNQKSHVEGMRAMAYMGAHLADQARTAATEEEARRYENRFSLMTPLIKAYCSDKGYEMTAEAIQVFGGYGYCGEYPVEQYNRDVKIASLYEGTNFIQSADLVGRKLNMEGGAVYQELLAEIDAFIDAHESTEELRSIFECLREAKAALLEATMELMNASMTGDLAFPMSVSTRFLHLFSEVVIGWLLAEQAVIAHTHLQNGVSDADKAFYAGKVIGARYFALNVLPGARMKAAVIKNGDRSCLEMPEAAF